MIGSGRIKKKIGRALGKYQKKGFEKFIYSPKGYEYFLQFNPGSDTDMELVTFVNAAGFPDLLLSILSFTKVAGRPRKWTLYADDEFSEQQMAIFSCLNFIRIFKWDNNLNEITKSRLGEKWQFRKFAAYSKHISNGTTIFTDSDVLFYPLFVNYAEAFESGNWYLPEPPEATNIDEGIADHFDYKKRMYIVNAGFFIVNSPQDWAKGIAYLDYCHESKKSHYFFDQSALNIMFYHDQNARILDPRVFHASADDHFRISALDTNTFAIRHYVGLIRHKMWQLGWKQFLK